MASLLPFVDLPPRTDIWRGDSLAAPALPGIASGFTQLDAQLPGNGWPLGALTEIYAEAEGIGELSLLAPALARLAAQDKWIACIAPPWLPYAPALAALDIDLARLLIVRPQSRAETLWAARQAIASQACSAVLCWLTRADMQSLRRLQLAAEASHTLSVLFRPAHQAQQATPAALKLLLQARLDGLALRILKRRGAAPAAPILLPQLQCTARALPHLAEAMAMAGHHDLAGAASAKPAAAAMHPC
jgi:cell division inhibitor SulA/protein ImuA